MLATTTKETRGQLAAFYHRAWMATGERPDAFYCSLCSARLSQGNIFKPPSEHGVVPYFKRWPGVEHDEACHENLRSGFQKLLRDPESKLAPYFKNMPEALVRRPAPLTEGRRRLQLADVAYVAPSAKRGARSGQKSSRSPTTRWVRDLCEWRDSIFARAGEEKEREKFDAQEEGRRRKEYLTSAPLRLESGPPLNYENGFPDLLYPVRRQPRIYHERCKSVSKTPHGYRVILARTAVFEAHGIQQWVTIDIDTSEAVDTESPLVWRGHILALESACKQDDPTRVEFFVLHHFLSPDDCTIKLTRNDEWKFHCVVRARRFQQAQERYAAQRVGMLFPDAAAAKCVEERKVAELAAEEEASRRLEQERVHEQRQREESSRLIEEERQREQRRREEAARHAEERRKEEQYLAVAKARDQALRRQAAEAEQRKQAHDEKMRLLTTAAQWAKQDYRENQARDEARAHGSLAKGVVAEQAHTCEDDASVSIEGPKVKAPVPGSRSKDAAPPNWWSRFVERLLG